MKRSLNIALLWATTFYSPSEKYEGYLGLPEYIIE
jgi:hypothetical protein